MLRRSVALFFVLALAAPLIVGALTPVGSARAAETKEFSPATFEAAKKAGPVFVDITAPWCPTCKAQKPILPELPSQPKFAKMTVLHVDFDSQKDVLKTLGVRMQSTLICYKDGQEVGRSTGVTDKAAIASQLDKSI